MMDAMSETATPEPEYDALPSTPGEATEATTAEVDVLVRRATELVTKGSITLDDILKAVAAKPSPLAAPAKLPVATPITAEQRRALGKLPRIFGKVVPTTRRALKAPEVTALMEERQVLTEIEKMTEKRKADIRTIIFNHFDCSLEHRDAEEAKAAERDGDGHYLVADEAPCPDQGLRFTRELRKGSTSLSNDLLVALVEAGELDHQDYLSMTTQVRVVDQNKVLIALRRKPSLVRAIAKATVASRASASMFARKIK